MDAAISSKHVLSESTCSVVDSSNSRAKHGYVPIEENEIRLIRILPGLRGSPIICEMVRSSLNSKPEVWECLSYMWGSPSDLELIQINNKSVHVRQNLWAALEAIRKEDISRTVWIDALCINQKDAAELNKHLTIMGEIYSRATKVLVWLGDSADDSELLFDPIIPDENWVGGYKWGGPYDRRTADAMLAFYSRPYWRRVWILQEILIAGSIEFFCGKQCIPMGKYREGFTNFVETMRKRLGDGTAPPWFNDVLLRDLESSPGCVILRQQYGGKIENFSLLRLLEMCVNCKSDCQLTHDRIYGLLGVLRPTQLGLIVPDYSKPLSHVYFDVYMALIIPDTAQDSHFISIWGYIGKDLMKSFMIIQNMLQQPLWNEKARAFYPLINAFSTSQIDKMKELSLDFWVEGVGVISDVGDVLSPEDFFQHNSTSLNQANAIHEENFRIASQRLTIKDLHSASQYIGLQYSKSLKDAPGTFFTLNDASSTEADEALLNPPTGETRLFITGNGLLGLASSHIQRGDLLYGFNALEGLFLGTNLYLIIRPKTDDLTCGFALVGRAIMLPAPEDQYCPYRQQYRKGKFAEFTFNEDLVAQGIDLDCEMFKEAEFQIDSLTLFLLTR